MELEHEYLKDLLTYYFSKSCDVLILHRRLSSERAYIFLKGRQRTVDTDGIVICMSVIKKKMTHICVPGTERHVDVETVKNNASLL